MVVWSSFEGKWAFGHLGCVVYAFGVGFCGLMSIFTLAAIAVERYMVITAKPLSSWKLTLSGARKVCAVSWLYSGGLTVPPMVGWSRYVPEGLLTSCSWDYTTRSTNNTSYYIFLLTAGFFLPVTIISYCYTFIIIAVISHGKEMAGVHAIPGSEGCGRREGRLREQGHNSQSAALRTAEVILTLVGLFLLAWSPYTVVTFIGQFGDRALLTPWVSALPAYFAKTSVIYNPIVYGLSHPHFRSTVKQYLVSCTRASSSPHEANPDRDDFIGPMQPLQPPSHNQHFRCFQRRSNEITEMNYSLAGKTEKRWRTELITNV